LRNKRRSQVWQNKINISLRRERGIGVEEEGEIRMKKEFRTVSEIKSYWIGYLSAKEIDLDPKIVEEIIDDVLKVVVKKQKVRKARKKPEVPAEGKGEGKAL